MSDRQQDPQPPPREYGEDACKVFITNLDGQQSIEAVEEELRSVFSPHGSILKLNVKKNKNGLYSFAFLEFDRPESATEAIKQLDQTDIFGKKMRVRQDRQSEGCFYCKRPGHFARQCPDNRQNKEREGRPQHREHRDRDYEQAPIQYRERSHPEWNTNERHYRQDRHQERYERYQGYDKRNLEYREDRHRRYPQYDRDRRQRYEGGRRYERSRSPSYPRHRRRSRTPEDYHRGRRDRYSPYGREERPSHHYRHQRRSPSDSYSPKR